MEPEKRLITNYAKTAIPNFLSIKSIVTVHYMDHKTCSGGGEAHAFWELLYVDKGTFRVFVDGVLYQLEAGQMIMYAAGAYHSGQCRDAFIGIVSFESDSEAMEYFANRCITLNRSQRELLSQIISSGMELFGPVPADTGLIGQMPHEGVDSFQLQKLKNLLEVLLIELHEGGMEKQQGTEHAKVPVSSNHNLLKRQQFDAITFYLKENLSEAVTLDSLSDRFGVSRSYLKLLFHEQCCCGPITYFNTLKTTEAKRLIRETSLNITQISEQLGFTSVHYFSRLFKKMTGQSPMEYGKSFCKR